MSEAKINGDAAVIDKLANGFADEAPIGEPMATDNDILDWLKLVAVGSRIELRTIQDGEPTSFVYTTNEWDLRRLAEAATKRNEAGADAYVTMNEIRGDKTFGACSSKDIARRRWLLIDVDPVRPPDVCATDSEKTSARAVVGRVREFLDSRGWPSPLLADSGNGYHLRYRIDLPVDDRGIVKRVLQTLAERFDADEATVDPVVSDPPRICKVYGTYSRKGQSTAERPHRRAAVLEAGDDNIVTEEQLEALAGEKATKPAANGNPKARTTKDTPFVIRDMGGDPVEEYGAAALDEEVDIMASTPPGGRNKQCFKSAAAVCELTNAGALPPGAVDEVRAAAIDSGLPEHEVDKTIRSAQQRTAGKARDISHVGNGNGRSRARPEPEPVDYSAMTDDDMGIERMSNIDEEPTNWLWKNRLPAGAMVLMAGDPGLGKSMLLLWIATAISKGLPWPDGEGSPPVGDTLFVSAEDDPSTIIKPRLVAMGADTFRISLVKAQKTIRKPNKPPVVHPQTLQDLDYWKAVLDKRPDTRLLVVDPLPSYLGAAVDDHRNQDFRKVMEPFIREVIRPRGVAMICNTHLNKNSSARSAGDRVMGSRGYQALARVTLFVAADPKERERRFLKGDKINVGAEDHRAIAFRIEGRTITNKAGAVIETAAPVFEAQPVDGVDLDEILRGDAGKGGGKPGPAPEKTEERAVALLGYMRDKGPILFTELCEFGIQEGWLTRRDDGSDKAKTTTPLGRAADHVAKLPPPNDGWEIVKSFDERSLLSATGKHRWIAKRKDQPLVVAPPAATPTKGGMRLRADA